jgi:hypothetical protein
VDVASQERGLKASLLEDAPRRRRWTIRQLLAWMVLATVVPLIVVLILTVVNIAKASRKAHVDALLYTTQTVVGALDAHLKQYVAIAEILAKSPALLNDDLSVFRAEAERAFPNAAEAALVVSDLNGQQLLNLLLPAGAPLPRRSETSLATQARAFSEKTFVISGVFRGQVRGEWVTDIEMPVFRDGRPFRSLTVTMSAKGIFKLLNAQKIPAGWLAGIIDTSGRFLARIPANDVYVGQLASASWREVMHCEGIFEFKTLEGHTTVGANLIEPISRWPVAVSAQTSVLDAPTWGTTKWAVIGMTAISMISLALALVIARVISQPIVDLEKQASALLAGKAARLHSELSEIDHAWATLKEAVAERRRAEDQQRFLQNELAHRSKNLLAIVQTLVRLMGRSTATAEQFADELQSRLHGLALAQGPPDEVAIERSGFVRARAAATVDVLAQGR